MSMEKTEVMCVGHQREELNIRLEDKEIKQVDGFEKADRESSDRERVLHRHA